MVISVCLVNNSLFCYFSVISILPFNLLFSNLLLLLSFLNLLHFGTCSMFWLLLQYLVVKILWYYLIDIIWKYFLKCASISRSYWNLIKKIDIIFDITLIFIISFYHILFYHIPFYHIRVYIHLCICLHGLYPFCHAHILNMLTPFALKYYRFLDLL